MIKITLEKIASYKNQVVIESEKKINLIYGLNGTGKSTFSNFLIKPNDPQYKHCSIQGLDTTSELLVYNTTFVEETFYQSEEISGIFTLSKINKDSIKRINEINNHLKTMNSEKLLITEKLSKNQDNINILSDDIREKVWKIKTDFTGGDRVFEYCFESLKKKDNLLNHLELIQKSTLKPTRSIEVLRNEIEAINGSKAKSYEFIPEQNINVNLIETDFIFQKTIIGNKNSSVSNLIESLGNSDWVKKGLNYLPADKSSYPIECPFCQEKSITENLIKSIQEFFDKNFQTDLESIALLKKEYDNKTEQIIPWTLYKDNLFVKEKESELLLIYNELVQVIDKNKAKIAEKVNSPGNPIELDKSLSIINNFNSIVKIINEQVVIHNEKIAKLSESLSKLKEEFWNLMRWEYDQTLDHYSSQKKKYYDEKDELIKSHDSIEIKIKNLNIELTKKQSKTLNIQEAINSINLGLINLGIDSFRIEYYKDNLYRLTRSEYSDKTFQSLSEGEKMIISFLYFIELCKGKISTTSIVTKKIIIIDDPISSLSHIYVFNIGQLIKKYFTNPNSDYEQIFILTHSLYFFYELTYMKKEDREKYQNLYRLIKNDAGTQIRSLGYSEIQNDYQTYWEIVKDPNQKPALIANCMRNIIEYFFGFIEKKELSNVFQIPEIQDVKFEAFYRYINRESHSLVQNIYDFKEFDYNIFVEAFKLVFERRGYLNHYNKMIN
ncbi:AAA domain protein [Leptospira interrogans str. FPW2026]|uniref:AAA family ATPase n=1 Tax=Leptospira interrogans TaxID=173 RepID=UPI0002784B94|nr:AAA family ATPase [Leptospira interrogans]EJP15811.1 AAA domain protein [Leptospira interrogans str. FPW2026]